MSGYLLDTHVLLWAGVGSDRLSLRARALLDDTEVDVRFSVASIWEVVIKSQLGRPDFRMNPEAVRSYARLAGLAEVPILAEHVLGVMAMPRLHNDPFDCLLIAQARAEKLTLLTADRQVLEYGAAVELIWRPTQVPSMARRP